MIKLSDLKENLSSTPILLSNYDTDVPKDTDKEAVIAETNKLVEEIGEMQEMLYASKKQSLLIVLQGMDGAGKDGAYKSTFRDSLHAGINYFSFKKPTEEEFAHDFLWRCHKLAPKKGYIQLFVRSHYEDILIQRVHNWIDEATVEKRMAAINDFERLLKNHNDTTVLKFFLHISPEKQLEKLQERKDDPTKNWKHNEGDWEERKYWDAYMKAYEYALTNSEIPWHIVPVDQRWYRNYFIAKVVHETLKSMNLSYPLLKK